MVSRSAAFIVGIFFIMSICDVFKAEEVEETLDDFKVEFRDEPNGGIQNKIEEFAVVVKRQNISSVMQNNQPKSFPILKFLYCVSCGYKQAFMQFSEFAKEKYPDIPIEGDNFPVEFWKTHLSQTISLAKGILLLVIMTGSNPFETLGFGYPRLLQYAHNNKLSSGMLIYLLGNMVEANLVSTGAFEIFLGGEQIWSKISTGRVPSQEEFIRLIDANLNADL